MVAHASAKGIGLELTLQRQHLGPQLRELLGLGRGQITMVSSAMSCSSSAARI